jgi:hypothetical protein
MDSLYILLEVTDHDVKMSAQFIEDTLDTSKCFNKLRILFLRPGLVLQVIVNAR